MQHTMGHGHKAPVFTMAALYNKVWPSVFSQAHTPAVLTTALVTKVG